MGDDCHDCDPACKVCRGWFIHECDECADGYFKQNGRVCKPSCPYDFKEDSELNICGLDLDKIYGPPVMPQDPQGCLDGWYWDWYEMKCL